MDNALELEERNGAWKEGRVSNFVRWGGSSRTFQPYKAPMITKSGGGTTSGAYGE